MQDDGANASMTHMYSEERSGPVSDRGRGGWSQTLLTLRKAWPQLAKQEQCNQQHLPAFPLFGMEDENHANYTNNKYKKNIAAFISQNSHCNKAMKKALYMCMCVCIYAYKYRARHVALWGCIKPNKAMPHSWHEYICCSISDMVKSHNTHTHIHTLTHTDGC